MCAFEWLTRSFSRFEEVADEDEEAGEEKPAKIESKKRPRESDAIEVDTEPQLSKSQRKKLNKKLKAEGGQAVAAGEEKQAEKPKAKKEAKKEKETKKEGEETKELAGGVQAVDHKVGTGRQAKKGDLVSMRYIGKLTNGKVFDSNTKGQPVRRLGHRGGPLLIGHV